MSLKQQLAILLVSGATCYLLLAAAKYALADYFYAQKDFSRAIALSPYEPIYKAEASPPTVTLLESAVKEAPHNVKLLKTVSLAYSDLAETDPSLLARETHILLTLSKLAPSDPWVTYQLALSYLKQGQRDLAVVYLKNTLSLKPDYKKAKDILTHFGILHI